MCSPIDSIVVVFNVRRMSLSHTLIERRKTHYVKDPTMTDGSVEVMGNPL